MNRRFFAAAFVSFLFFASAQVVLAQGTAFSYQGTLNDNSIPANGTYDFEFTLYDTLNGGSPIGPTIEITNVPVMDGSFSVELDFGDQFSGSPRFLAISVRPGTGLAEERAGTPPFTPLSPRQQILSVPYAVKSQSAGVAETALNADRLGGLTASRYVLTTDPRMSDARTPTAGSADYIQNTTKQQASSDFYISGTGRADILSANTEFRIGSGAVLRTPGTANTFVGRSAGVANPIGGGGNSFFGSESGENITTGGRNSFFGLRTGQANTSGERNSFFGGDAGANNTTGFYNSFFGGDSGFLNETGNSNSFFGVFAGNSNTTGSDNSFFGRSAGRLNTVANNNSFFGTNSGASNTTASFNSFFGANAGLENTVGLSNSFFGAEAGRDNTDGSSNSFFGTGSGQSNISGLANSFFGMASGAFNTLGIQNSFFGRNAGLMNSIGSSNSFLGSNSGLNNTKGAGNSFVGKDAGDTNATGSNNSVLGMGGDVGSADLTYATAIGSGAVVNTSNTIQLGRTSGADTVNISGDLVVGGTFTGALPADSSSYIQNSANQQASSEFNVSGTGKAHRFDAALQYDIGGVRVLSILGSRNVFVGAGAGASNAGAQNSFFGIDAGLSNDIGDWNSFFGDRAGQLNTSGNLNSFFGQRAGVNSTTGTGNSFFGAFNGISNTVGANNSAFGRAADVGSPDLSFATAIGAFAIVTTNNTIQLGRAGSDVVRIGTLGSSGSTSLCLNGSNVISGCLPSSIRYKFEVRDLTGGLDAVRRLRPVTFSWKSDGTADIGLIAEEVERVEPLLTQEKNGRVERVRYNLLGVLLIGAVQEQQKTIEVQGSRLKVQSEELKRQADELKAIQAELAALKAMVCAANPGAAACN